ncbi:hypothetical protein FRC12_020325, partial [Ceratobasidium sp. 428]
LGCADVFASPSVVPTSLGSRYNPDTTGIYSPFFSYPSGPIDAAGITQYNRSSVEDWLRTDEIDCDPALAPCPPPMIPTSLPPPTRIYLTKQKLLNPAGQSQSL